MLKPSQPAYYCVLPSPIGDLLLIGDGNALADVCLPGSHQAATLDTSPARDDGLFRRAALELQAYFAGELKQFDLALAPRGSAFQHMVWSALLQLPYGSTTSYGHLATRLNYPSAARAVGLANGRNPIPIIIPCHRLIGGDGSLVGYGGGLDRKRWLLDLEARVTAGDSDARPGR